MSPTKTLTKSPHIIVITGISRGLGRAMALKFASLGFADNGKPLTV